MKSVIVSGGSGFIGQHFCKYLSSNDYDVYEISRADLYSNDLGFFSHKFKSDANVIVHLVGAAHQDFSDEESLESNFITTKKIIDRAISLGIQRFIFLSTINLYSGNGNQINLTSQINSSNLKNTLQTKKMAEDYIKYSSFNNKIEFVIIRSPLVYGKNVKANFSFLMNLVSKKLPLPFGTFNSNRRSLVSVYNLVDLIKVCLDHPKAANQIFLVSDDDDLSTTAMVKLMSNVQGLKPIIFPFPVWCFKLLGRLIGKSDMISRLTDSLQVDITHTKETLNWKPPYSVEEGFAKCVENKNKNKKENVNV